MIETDRPQSHPMKTRALSAILWTFDKVNQGAKFIRRASALARGSWYFVKHLWEADQAVREAQKRREEKLRVRAAETYSGGLR